MIHTIHTDGIGYMDSIANPMIPAPSICLNISYKKYSHNMRSYMSHILRYIDPYRVYRSNRFNIDPYRSNRLNRSNMIKMNDRFFLNVLEHPAPFDQNRTEEK